MIYRIPTTAPDPLITTAAGTTAITWSTVVATIRAFDTARDRLDEAHERRRTVERSRQPRRLVLLGPALHDLAAAEEAYGQAKQALHAVQQALGLFEGV